MRSVSLAASAAILLLALPASAQEPVTEHCDQRAVAAADYWLSPEGLSATIDTPLLPSPYPLGLGGEPDPLGFQEAATQVHTAILDVSPYHRSAGTVEVTLDWEHTGDVDLDVYVDGELRGGSHDFNPLQGNAESVDFGPVNHCQTVEVHVRNYIATHGDIDMRIEVRNLSVNAG